MAKGPVSAKGALPSKDKQLKKDNLTLLQEHRLAIICAKATEADLVARELRTRGNITAKIPGNLVHDLHPGHDFYLGSFKTGGHDMPFYITACSRQGIQTFGIEAAAMFSILKPEYAIHLGSCAALGGGKIKLGDVIFGERALNYEEGKTHTQGPGEARARFEPSTNILTTGSERMDGYVTRTGRELYKYGDFISGCALRLDAQDILNRVQKEITRDCKALEMEASAFLQVCDHMGIHALGIIKGVSDMGDQNRNDDKASTWETSMVECSRAALDYCRYHFEQPPPPPPSLDRQLGAQIASKYLESYVFPVTDEVTDNDFEFGDAPNKVELRGLKIVLPRDGDNLKRYDPRRTKKSFRLEELNVKVREREREREITLSHKKGYLFDFPLGLKDLADTYNLPNQIEYFHQRIKQEYPELNMSNSFEVEVITFEDFKKFCDSPDQPPNGQNGQNGPNGPNAPAHEQVVVAPAQPEYPGRGGWR